MLLSRRISCLYHSLSQDKIVIMCILRHTRERNQHLELHEGNLVEVLRDKSATSNLLKCIVSQVSRDRLNWRKFRSHNRREAWRIPNARFIPPTRCTASAYRDYDIQKNLRNIKLQISRSYSSASFSQIHRNFIRPECIFSYRRK